MLRARESGMSGEETGSQTLRADGEKVKAVFNVMAIANVVRKANSFHDMMEIKKEVPPLQ